MRRTFKQHRSLGLIPIWFLVVGALLVTSSSWATTSKRTAYTLKQVYSAAIRLVRVDRNFAVTEKDPDIAYILFKYKSTESGKRVTRGSFEIVPQRNSVLILLKLPQMPQYHEQMLMRALLKKLRDEYGAPIRRIKPSPHKDRPKEAPPPNKQPDTPARRPRKHSSGDQSSSY